MKSFLALLAWALVLVFATFDALVSADEETPLRLEKDGLALPERLSEPTVMNFNLRKEMP